MNPTPTFQQRALLRRMRAAGCPLDNRNLTAPSLPLAIVNHPMPLAGGGVSNVFFRDGQVWIVLNVEMSIARKVEIGGLHLRAHWLAEEAALVKPCPEHQGSYCVPACPGGEHWSPPHRTLNSWTERREQLLPGWPLKGHILAKGTGFLATNQAENLDIDVCIEDWLGREMVFPVVLVDGRWQRQLASQTG